MNFVVGAWAPKRRLQLLALILFCGASSGFYLINDIADVESDRRSILTFCQNE
jgi:4-hydroxybenzoate polyprenyltransferase